MMTDAMRIYFNDNEPYVAQWLRNLWPESQVDETSIKELREVPEASRVHLFAGIGGWEYALQLAGWPSDVPVWTGSCPCQPFSTAGKRKGVTDDRHLWPDMFRLIEQHRPAVVLGEQVASKDGRLWLSGVRTDLEALGYGVGAADLCAAGVAAPHLRQRLYFGAVRLADTEHNGRDRPRGTAPESDRDGADGRVHVGSPGGLEHAAGDGRIEWRSESGGRGASARRGDSGMGDADESGSQGWWFRRDGTRQRFARPTGLGNWQRFDLIECADGKTRRFEPGIFPLADGIPARVAKLRAIGNSIVPQLAAEFIRSFMESVLPTC